jgi:hypothetical protein
MVQPKIELDNSRAYTEIPGSSEEAADSTLSVIRRGLTN